MFQYFLVVYLLSQCHSTYQYVVGNEVIQDQELFMAFLVNRHGERTPDKSELSLSNEQNKIKNITLIEGYEELTNAGKRRAYQIGKFIRQRYGSQGHNLLSNLYLRDEIAVRSTNKERTKMTALVALAALYPPEHEQQWDEGLGKVWQPVPYDTAPLSTDYLRYYDNCQRFKDLMDEAVLNSWNERFSPYEDLLPKIKAETGRNFTENPLLFETLYDLLQSQLGLGLGIPEWAEPIISRLTDAAQQAYKLYFKTDEMKKIGGGVILHQFIQAASQLAAGKPVTKRFRLFSAHDFNIGALIESTSVAGDHTIPHYGAVFALEFYRSRRTGEYSVMPVYLSKAGASAATPLRFSYCETEYCSFTKFLNATKRFVLSEEQFYETCKVRNEL